MSENNCPFDVTPLDQSEPIESQHIVSLNYTNQDFYSLKSRLVEFIRQRFDEKFNDFVESNLAIMLIENYAFIADMLSFKIDQTANEVFIDTVTEIDNAFRLAQLVGLEPTPPIAARTLWQATINTPLTTDLQIESPLLAQVGTINIEIFPADANNNPIFDEPIVITAGNLINNSLVGLEGITTTDVFSGTGLPNQTVQAANNPVIFDSVRVSVDGIPWDKVDYFTDSKQRREFRVEFDSEYNAFIIFGNSRAGLIPSTNSVIEVTYRIGGGEDGNIVTGFVDIQKTFNVPNVPFKVPVAFRNTTQGQFGYNGDTVDDIRRKLPEYTRMQNRAVTGTDYKTLADQFATPYQGQIGKSTAVLRNYGCAGNVIDLYVLARDGDSDLVEASNELKESLKEELETKQMLTDYICIRNGEIIFTDVLIDLTVDKSFKNAEEELRERVNRRIDSFFRLTEWEYGDDLKESEVIRALADIDEIISGDITFTTDDDENSGDLVTARYFEIIRPDEITITFNFV